MDEQEFNIYGLLAVLELLTTSKKFLDAYVEKYQENEADALSYSVDPGCNCRDNLIKHYNSNAKDVNEFTRTFITNNSSELNWSDFIQRNETNPVAGKIVEIEKTPEAYANLVRQMHNERWVFRHMNITTDENSYVIFFA
jgi:hypothetical protein